MAYIITEEKSRRRSIFHLCEIDETGHTLSREDFTFNIEKITRIREPQKDGTVRETTVPGHNPAGENLILIKDSQGVCIKEAYDWLNNLRADSPNKTRYVMAQAIAAFHMFFEMKGYNPAEATYAQIEEFVRFLLGASVRPEGNGKVTRRNAKTVNAWLSILRRYIRTKFPESKAFEIFGSDDIRHAMTSAGAEGRRYRIADPNPHCLRVDPFTKQRLPTHPTPEQFVKLQNLAKNDPIEAVRICIILQYYKGLRCGELLGLTIEDLQTFTVDDEERYRIVIRNRVTDNTDQSAKGKMHPLDKNAYKSSGYIASKDEIEINKRMYALLMSYFKAAHSVEALGFKQASKVRNATVADAVEKGGGPNCYIFVNRQGRRLTAQTYCAHLKRLFKEVGLALDEDVKHYNVSHQLRHGFVMNRTQYSRCPETLLEAKASARHASITSTEVYFNELPEVIRERNEQFDRELDELIMESEGE